MLKKYPDRASIELLLRGLNVAQQCARLRELFIGHAKNHQDGQTLFALQLIMAAVAERISQQRPATNDHKENSKTEYLVAIKQARMAQGLFPLVPTFKPKDGFVPGPAKDIGDWMEIEPTLQETRQEILRRVLIGWKAAQDDKTADTFFSFYLDAADSASEIWMKAWNKKERDIFGDLLRATIDGGCAESRLAHTVAVFGPSLFGPNGKESRKLIIGTLGTGWVKTTRLCDLWRLLTIIEPLINPSRGRFIGYAERGGCSGKIPERYCAGHSTLRPQPRRSDPDSVQMVRHEGVHRVRKPDNRNCCSQ